MRKARKIVVGAAIVAAVNGCGWLSPRNGTGRDPLLMSHLTHGKGDPMFAGSENGSLFDDDVAIKAASVSRKYTKESPNQLVSQESLVSSPRDYSWLEGRLEKRAGSRPGWYLRYATNSCGDPHDGALLLEEDARLGLLRVGDRVHVEGSIQESKSAPAVYKLSSIRILEEN